jgi:putative transposase
VEITRTIKLKIDLDIEVAQQFIGAFTNACNYVSQIAFTQCVTSFLKLNELCYANVRTQFGLSAQVAQSVCRIVSAKYVGAKSNKVRLSQAVDFKCEPVLLQGGERQRDFGFTKEGRLSISTLQGRVKVAVYYYPHLQEYRTQWQLGGAYLYVRNNQVYLAVSYSREVEVQATPANCVIGVDRGLNYIAVAASEAKTLFVGGGKIRERREHYLRTRASLQSRKAQKSTSSVRRAWKRLRGKEQRFSRSVNHIVSKQLVEFAKQAGRACIALEDLKGIRKSAGTGKRGKNFNNRLHRWGFYQLAQFVEYKAETAGLHVIKVDPKYTSQGCCKCGHTEKANRNGHAFGCKACGYRVHSDLNAARNIRLRGILARQVLSEDGVSSITPKAPDILGANPDQSR